MTETVGQREDAEAFAEWLLTLIGFGMYPDRRLARTAFDAGMKRGEAQLAEAVGALANIAGAAAARSADTRLPAEARDSFGWIDGRARAALEPHE